MVSVPKTPSVGFAIAGESEHDCWTFAIAFLFVLVLCDCFKSRWRLEAEIMVLRHQLNLLQLPTRRQYLTWIDRALFVWLYRGFPRILDAIAMSDPRRSCGGIVKALERFGDAFGTAPRHSAAEQPC
jgi:hypothetical protein